MFLDGTWLVFRPKFSAEELETIDRLSRWPGTLEQRWPDLAERKKRVAWAFDLEARRWETEGDLQGRPLERRSILDKIEQAPPPPGRAEAPELSACRR